MTGTIHAFDFLETPPDPISPVCVAFGDEEFFKRLVRNRLRESVLGVDADAPFATYDGESSQWCDVADEIATVSLFGGKRRRFVIVESADDFVTKFRSHLEAYVQHPKRTGVLLLEVGTWPANTRLYKILATQGCQIDCRLPQKTSGNRSYLDEARLISWTTSLAATRHNIKLDAKATKRLFEIAGSDIGILDQELAKLALFVKPNEKVTEALVQDVIGGWRSKTIWEIIEAATEGNAAEALRQLDRAFHSGEPPLALFGQISWSLRRFAVATRIVEREERRGRRIGLRDALLEAGFRPWPADALSKAEEQLKQLGRERAGKMLQWLLEADLALKGSHSSPERARFVLEQLFLRMSKKPTTPRRATVHA